MSRRRKPLGLSNGHGLYFHSSPPKVFNNTDEFGKIQYEFIRNIANKTNALVIKPSNIRIWIHDKDIDKLMRVVLEGHGHKLRNEVANQPKVKRFLEYVPHFLGLIKGIHQAVVDNNIEILRAKTSPPVPPQMLSCKDVNGLTPLHKAAGLGHGKIVEYLLNTWPNTATEIDNSGKTPLHYAASLKNNERIFNILIQAGADEMGIDGNGHTPAYYKKSKNSEDIDRALLVAIPDAPRVAEQGFPPSFDWNILPAKFFSENSIRSSQSEFNLSHVKENTMKASSSAFEILSRSNSHQMEDESDPKHEQESEREPVTKKSSKKVQRPKTFNKNDVNNNSTKGKEMNDDDDVETGKAVGSETLLPEERLQKQTTSVKSHQSNPEPDHNNDNDNVNLIDNDNDQMTDSKTLNRIDSESQLMENKEIKDENVVDVGETSNEEKLNEISEDNFDEKGQNKDDEKFQETSQKEIEENFQDDNKEKANEKSHEINDEKSLESSQQNDDELNKNVDILILEDSSQDNEKSKDVNDGDNDKEEEEEDKLSSRQQSAASINDHVDNEIGESSEIKEKENSEIKESKTEEEERKVETLDINFEHPPTPAPKNSENNVIDVAENSKEAGESTTKDIDSNGNSDEEQMDVDNDHEIGSPSPPIEGFITEEAEKQLESQGGDFDTSGFNGDINDDDPLQKLINAGDMEQLALLVLNGNGKQLIGRTSNQPDIQAFLDNVQTYVNKIRKVHVAAREGSLRDLQAALDRRKFSTAKDEVSPNGTTPLHVAVIFGHTAIIRYLGSRFQETLSATDEDNRTALHYAATIKDNGHFYNLLVHLGANPKSTDNLGRTAESYLNHDETDKILSHKDLLKAFGAEEGLADEMLNDQEYKNNQPVEIPLFRTEEGRYLATSLGDPLIKGLTEVANQRPSDPIAFLANYLQNFSTDKPKTSSNKKSEITKPEPKTEANETKPKSGKTLIPVKQKSVENFIDDDNTDSTPGSEERDEHGQSMLHFAAARHFELAGFLDRLQEFEENRERLLHAVRHSDINTVKEVLSLPDAAKLARAKNYYGRCSIHIAVLLENEEIVDYLATNFRQTLRTGDNLERTALHYSMGINNVEAISRILIKNGAKRVLKDLKGRTPSFYYINKSDILRLQEEERE
ncbi:CLUMA_CG017287, isoform B [Clunio marinus]|uniref:CLUMA_CG017287, isoform B n=1 Tax=Clunio marinus TaxID=568069 RepID=A0A1J1IX93_9DIPT|nr:CLUMA_CG017287, isoform B [Clunio marinus]